MPRRNWPRVPERRRAPEVRVQDFEEVVLAYTTEEARQEALRCLRCRRAPCTLACPLGTRADLYIPLIAEGRLDEAAAMLAERDPFPAICARVCHHPCEEVCLAGKVDGPVAIRALKRFVAEFAGKTLTESGSKAPLAPAVASNGHASQVAVVGSGPAGLMAAWELALLGYDVTVFEALTEPGGLLRWGIPAYRLPRHLTAATVAAMEEVGVAFRTGVRLGEDLTIDDLFASGYGAIFLAIGAHRSRALNVPGEDLPWVVPGLDFLRQAAGETPPAVDGAVVVIGGGDAAIDAARSARRLGATSVTVVYRRSREEMPARTEEVVEAEEEGIAFRFLAAPLAISEDPDRMLHFQSMRLEPSPDGGRPVPVPVPDACWSIEADLVIVAAGQTPDARCIPSGIRLALKGGTVDVDPETLATSIPGVFAGGDAAGGRANVTDASAMGRRAAHAIHEYLCKASHVEDVECLEHVASFSRVASDEDRAGRAIVA
jgi:NADH-quinone oxidoreductase subunit F